MNTDLSCHYGTEHVKLLKVLGEYIKEESLRTCYSVFTLTSPYRHYRTKRRTDRWWSLNHVHFSTTTVPAETVFTGKLLQFKHIELLFSAQSGACVYYERSCCQLMQNKEKWDWTVHWLLFFIFGQTSTWTSGWTDLIFGGQRSLWPHIRPLFVNAVHQRHMEDISLRIKGSEWHHKAHCWKNSGTEGNTVIVFPASIFLKMFLTQNPLHYREHRSGSHPPFFS